MAAKAQLMALGQPAAAAHFLGFDAPATIASAGSTAGTAAALASSFSTVSGTGGVLLKPASASGSHILIPTGASTVYPAQNGIDFINALAPGAGFPMTANKPCYLIPNGSQWVAMVSA